MKNREFDKLVNDTIDDCKNIMLSKGGEYAHGDDRLDNFKRNAQILGLDPLEVWAVYFHKHIDAIDTFVTDIGAGKEDRPRSESITGRYDDAINYLLLGKALVIEKEKSKK